MISLHVYVLFTTQMQEALQQQFVDSSDSYNHYSLLATLEKLWNLGCLDNACGFSKSELMTKFFV